VVLQFILGGLAFLSLALTLWQWVVARRFPLHTRVANNAFAPPVTLLKPLKGCDEATDACLRSWFMQEYLGPVQLLFGVASADDPVCGLVTNLLKAFPSVDARLVVCGPLCGANLKVSKLEELESLASHEVLIISDADVRVPSDFLTNVVEPLQVKEEASQPSKVSQVALVNCFYRLANPSTLAMRWEAIAINADFWSQVLQAQSLKPLDFALGAVMVTRRERLRGIGGFAALANCLADDYQLGHRIAHQGYRIALCPVVVECWSAPMGWLAVWKHQLRWARTIRVCQPLPYFFSILHNATFWPLLWLAVRPSWVSLALGVVTLLVRLSSAQALQRRLRGPVAEGIGEPEKAGNARMTPHSKPAPAWLIPIKDLLQTALWILSFLGNHVEWRGEKMRLRGDGTLVRKTGEISPVTR
jgi:ceramide glucosyltransferase